MKYYQMNESSLILDIDEKNQFHSLSRGIKVQVNGESR